MKEVPQNVSESVRKLNPHLYDIQFYGKETEPDRMETKSPKRIRQSKVKLNNLEQEWLDNLSSKFPNYPRPRAQSLRLKIANGGWYKGDIFSASWPQPDGPAMPTIWECKGGEKMKGVPKGKLTLKVAAYEWPEIAFWLVWKDDDGNWRLQKVLP